MPTSEVFNMDCMEGMKAFPDKFFDLAIVDPPYGINAPNMQMGTNENRKPKFKGEDAYPNTSTATRLRKGRLNAGAGKLKNRALNNMNCDWDFEKPTQEYFEELFRISKHQIIWGGNYFNLPPTRGIVCWDKMQPWENFSQWEMAWTSFDCPAVMIRCSNTGGANTEEKIHPTQKPLKVYNELYRRFAQPGFKVIDTHLGSGNNRIVAYKLGFDFWGFEIDETYFKDSVAWFKKSTHEPLFQNVSNKSLFA